MKTYQRSKQSVQNPVQLHTSLCKKLTHDDDTRRLRHTLGKFPTGVAVVTTIGPTGEPVGMTINSFNSISLIPALVGWSIDRKSASYQVFAEARHFGISVLNESQREIARRFAQRGADKFKDLTVEVDRPVLIPNACAWFQCRTFQRFRLGDHLMLVGKVITSEKTDAAPLIFAQGEFHNLPAARAA